MCPTELPKENYCVWPTQHFHKDLTYALTVRAVNNLGQVYGAGVSIHTKRKGTQNKFKESSN